jgi:hypothetical protein
LGYDAALRANKQDKLARDVEEWTEINGSVHNKIK